MKKVVQVMLEPEDIRSLENEAKKRGHTISSLIRFVVVSYLREQKSKKPGAHNKLPCEARH